jgi:hypothetical protein
MYYLFRKQPAWKRSNLTVMSAREVFGSSEAHFYCSARTTQLKTYWPSKICSHGLILECAQAKLWENCCCRWQSKSHGGIKPSVHLLSVMPKGKLISEDLRWAIVRMAPFVDNRLKSLYSSQGQPLNRVLRSAPPLYTRSVYGTLLTSLWWWTRARAIAVQHIGGRLGQLLDNELCVTLSLFEANSAWYDIVPWG